jgi:hypothetical protein
MAGKDCEANTAMAFYRMAGITGEAKYTRAATQLAERLIKAMRSSAVGLLDIKEWGPTKIMYGAPPPLGYYAAYTAISKGRSAWNQRRWLPCCGGKHNWVIDPGSSATRATGQVPRRSRVGDHRCLPVLL